MNKINYWLIFKKESENRGHLVFALENENVAAQFCKDFGEEFYYLPRESLVIDTEEKAETTADTDTETNLVKKLEKIKKQLIDAYKQESAKITRETENDFNAIEAALVDYQSRIEELEETNNLMFLREQKNGKKLRILEIIKEARNKGFNFDYLLDDIAESDSYEEFDEKCYSVYSGMITEKEYDLLRGVLL